MKPLITIGILLISSIIYSQRIKIIDDDDFTFSTNNQSFVTFKIRVIEEVGVGYHHTSEQIKNGQYSPSFKIMEFDDFLDKKNGKWNTRISTRSIQEKIKEGYWAKKGENTVYEWLYLLETKPNKRGYYFETISFISGDSLMNIIPFLRKIDVENNRLYNYGTIEITVYHSERKPSHKLLNDEIEKEKIITSIEALYPNIYNSYKDKVSDDKLKFFFAITTVGEIKKKTSYDYWSKLYGDGIDGQTGHGITINSKKNGQSQQTYISFEELTDLPANFDITFRSEWKKGELDRPYGLILGNRANNKYFFYTTTNGKSGIEGTTNGTTEVSEISNRNASSPDKLNKENDCKIEIRNKKATYYINNIKIGIFDLNSDLSEDCFVGFMVKDKQRVYFDKFQIIEQ